jgi:curved DNA-binding protein CbpA
MTEVGNPEQDYYAILRLPQGASAEQVRRQYRRLAKIYHPDRNPGEEDWCTEQLRLVNQAFTFLNDPANKTAYDDKVRQRSQRSRSGGAPGGGFNRPADARNSSFSGPEIRSQPPGYESRFSSTPHNEISKAISPIGIYTPVLRAFGAILVCAVGIVIYQWRASTDRSYVNNPIVQTYHRPHAARHPSIYQPRTHRLATIASVPKRRYTAAAHKPRHPITKTQMRKHTQPLIPFALSASDKAALAQAEEIEKAQHGGN